MTDEILRDALQTIFDLSANDKIDLHFAGEYHEIDASLRFRNFYIETIGEDTIEDAIIVLANRIKAKKPLSKVGA